MQTTEIYKFCLVLLYSLLVGQLTAQDCTLQFDGKSTLCLGEITRYTITPATTIDEIQWTLDSDSIGSGSSIQIDWDIYQDGSFQLCANGITPCNGAIPQYCHTIKTLPTTVLDSTITLCTGKFISVYNLETNWRDTAFSTTDTHHWTYTSSSECRDVTYNLTILPTETIELSDTSICQGDYIYMGIDSFNTSGRHCGRVFDEEGCITFDCRTLEVRDSIKTILDTTICNEAIPFAIEDTLITTNSRFIRTFTAVDGCDSTLFVNVRVRDAIASSRRDTLCAEDNLIVGDSSFNISGTHQYIFESIEGCDSTVTINLLMRAKIETSDYIELCENDLLPINQDIVTLEEIPNTDIPDTTFVKGVAIAQNGCDSTINYTVVVKPKSYVHIDTTLCYGASINIGNNIIRSAAKSSTPIVLTNQYDCDSIITYSVLITPEQPMFEFRQVVCPGVELYVGDSLLTESGYHEIFVPNERGCDSLVIADIIVKTETDVTNVIDDILCIGDVYRAIRDTIIRTPGTHVLTHLKTRTDCDSIIILNLEQLSGEDSEITTEFICAGDYFVHPEFPLDTLRTEFTTFLAKRNPKTCVDFDLAITIEFKDSIHVTVNELLCEGDSVALGGNFYKEAGTFIDTLQRTGELGCDSIVTLKIEVRDCNIEIEESIDSVDCHTNSTGNIEFFVTEGKPPLIYQLQSTKLAEILTDSIFALGDVVVFDSLVAGTYTLTLVDTINGYSEFDLVVPQPEVLSYEWEESDKNGFQLACNGDKNGFVEILVDGGTKPYSYLWNTGDKVAGMTGLSANTYMITVTDASGCQLLESYRLNEPSPITSSLAIMKPNCENLAAGNISIETINGGVSPYEYKLLKEEDFAAKNIFRNLEAGEYRLMIKDANSCIDTNIIDLPFPKIPELKFERELFIELGEEVELDTRSTVSLIDVLWEGPNSLSCYTCPHPIALPLETQTFTVTGMSEDSCSITESLTIFVDKKRDVFVPNIFSPNSDGINDHLVIHGGPEVENILSFQVYARWGNLVYEGKNLLPNESANTWDGTFKGKRLRPGVYVWKSTISFIDGVEKEYFGDIVIK